jgi:succinate dehydrogenase / fumarate reductase cytochrome b subunit
MNAKARERNLNTPLWPFNYRLGMWIWLAQRVSGLVLVAYVIAHIFVISFSMAGKTGQSFDGAMELLENPIFVAGELLLFAVVLLHILNGIRVMLFNLGIGVRNQKAMFWVCIAIAFVLWAYGSYFLLPYVFGKQFS